MKPARLLLLPMLMLALPAGAASEWRVNGSNTLRFEHYEVRGNEAASPYAHQGTQMFNDINLNLTGRQSPGSLWRFQFAGVLNDSDYRADETGFIAERISLFHERTDVALPFRLELGDQLMRMTPLTLQRPLKGARLELLPQSAVDGRQHSFMVFAGADETTWRDFDAKESQYRGASWALADNDLGRFSANVVYHSQEGEDDSPDASEWVGSLMGERSFDFAHQRLLAQGEWARFVGDSELERSDQYDRAVTARLSGRDQLRPLSYEVSYERYGGEFRPSGVKLPAHDYRSYGARAGIGLGGDVELQARGQWARHGYESLNPVDSDTVGLTISGPVGLPMLEPVHSSADVTVQSRESESGHIDDRVTTARLDLGLPLIEAGETRVGMLWSGFDNRHSPGTDRVTRQLSISQGVTSQAGEFALSARAGVVYREVEGDRSQQVTNPTLSLSASSEAHRFGINLGYRRFETDAEFGLDVETYVLGVQYQFRQERHTLGLEFDQELRAPDEHENTESWRVGAFWRYSFDHSLRR